MAKDPKGHGSNKRGGTGTQGMRLVKTHTNGPHSAKVYKNPEWSENVVKFFHNGVYQPKADHHTDDMSDAHATAQFALGRYADQDAAKALSSGPKSNPVATHDAFSVGDRVHLGFGAKGGAGYFGKLTKLSDHEVEIAHDNGKTYSGPRRLLSK
jgi:hypothetical protein